MKNPTLLPALMAGLGLLLAGQAAAQTFSNLHRFTGGDGADPLAGVIVSGNTLYGTTYEGGSSNYGTVFAVNTDGTGFTNLHVFTLSGDDDTYPVGGLILSGNTLYGTAQLGGGGEGTVFAINTNGTGFTNLYVFTNGIDGANPDAGLILSGNTLYGTAYGDISGSSGNGSVFGVNTDGTGFTNLHSFTAVSGPGFGTNSDGANPDTSLILSGNTLYGTACRGGNWGRGTVFAVNTDGTGFTNLHSFTATSGNYPYTNSDGSFPYAGLIIWGNTLYGTASGGGSGGGGTVFAINTDGTGFTNLYNFTAPSDSYPYTNSDGAYPWAGLTLSGNTLYGTTLNGGSGTSGVVFAVRTNGTGFTNLYNFTATSDPTFMEGSNGDGAYPYAGLIISGNTLYGTAHGGGSSGDGTVFSLSFAPQLTIILSGQNVILSWPTNMDGFDYSGFTLRSATDLSAAPLGPVSPALVVVNGRNTVTNPICGTQQFYRLGGDN